MEYLADVFLNPVQGLPLIFQAVVQAATLTNFLRCQKSMGTNSIIEVHDDQLHAARFDQRGAVV